MGLSNDRPRITDDTAGGLASGPGYAILWQTGTMGISADKDDPNGASVIDIVRAAAGRLQHMQSAGNGAALKYLHAAIDALDDNQEIEEE